MAKKQLRKSLQKEVIVAIVYVKNKSLSIKDKTFFKKYNNQF